jgi:hypothetical protein
MIIRSLNSLSVVIIAVGLIAVGLAGAADYKIQEWRFDTDAPGSVPAGFVPGTLNGEAGRWEVAADPKAPSPPHVLVRQAGQSNKDQIIFIDGLEAGSLDLTVRIKAAAASETEGGGVVFRADDDRNYYVVWLSPSEKLLRLDKVVNGQVTHLQDLQVDNGEPGRWHTLRLMIHGPVMDAVFNNRQLLSGREEKWEFGTYKKGKIGLWARGDAPIYFDTVRYSNMDESTASNAPFGGPHGESPKK